MIQDFLSPRTRKQAKSSRSAESTGEGVKSSTSTGSIFDIAKTEPEATEGEDAVKHEKAWRQSDHVSFLFSYPLTQFCLSCPGILLTAWFFILSVSGSVCLSGCGK